MTYKIVVQPEAEFEITAAHLWYEKQANRLGTEFLRAVDVCLSTIQRRPKAYARVYKQVRRALVRKFPYAIFYIIEAETIIVIACFLKRWRSASYYLRFCIS